MHKTFLSLLSFVFTGNIYILKAFFKVKGFLYPQEGAFLYKLAKQSISEGSIVEIGSMNGLSTLCSSIGLLKRPESEYVYSIDPHLYGTYSEFTKNLNRFAVTHRVKVIKARSVEVAGSWSEPPVRAVFIDGSHNVLDALEDFSVWLPHILPGGFLLMHDSTELSPISGPRFAARKKIVPGDTFDITGTVGTITWGRLAGGENWHPKVQGSAFLDKALLYMKRRRLI